MTNTIPTSTPGTFITRSSSSWKGTEYQAWEVDCPDAAHEHTRFHNHSSISHTLIDGPARCYGTIASRSLTPELEELPYGPDRTRRVKEYQAARKQEAYDLIVATCPEARGGRRSMGEINL